MALKEGDRTNFETLTHTFAQRDIALVECTDAKAGEYVAVLCVVQFVDGQYEFVPLARPFMGNPCEEVNPPPAEDP